MWTGREWQLATVSDKLFSVYSTERFLSHYQHKDADRLVCSNMGEAKVLITIYSWKIWVLIHEDLNGPKPACLQTQYVLMGQFSGVATLLLAYSVRVLVEHSLYEWEQLSLLAWRWLWGVKSCEQIDSYTWIQIRAIHVQALVPFWLRSYKDCFYNLQLALLWFNPGWQLNTMQPLAHSPQWDGGENWKGEKCKNL